MSFGTLAVANPTDKRNKQRCLVSPKPENKHFAEPEISEMTVNKSDLPIYETAENLAKRKAFGYILNVVREFERMELCLDPTKENGSQRDGV